MLLSPELFEEGNCELSMFCASWDSVLFDPPKLVFAMLYETEEKKLGISVRDSKRATTHAIMIKRCRFLMKELNGSKRDRDKY